MKCFLTINVVYVRVAEHDDVSSLQTAAQYTSQVERRRHLTVSGDEIAQLCLFVTRQHPQLVLVDSGWSFIAGRWWRDIKQ